MYKITLFCTFIFQTAHRHNHIANKSINISIFQYFNISTLEKNVLNIVDMKIESIDTDYGFKQKTKQNKQTKTNQKEKNNISNKT